MRCELPLFKRCCCCMPLRYGLLTWGYLKLIIGGLIILRLSYGFIEMSYIRQILFSDLVLTSILLFAFVLDFVLTLVYVIGAHKKNVKLLRVFYYYSQVTWVGLVLLVVVATGLNIQWFVRYLSVTRLMYLVIDSCLFFVGIVLEFYILLLLRSEIIKLNRNCEFRFVNNAANAECTMTSKDDVTNGEEGIEAA